MLYIHPPLSIVGFVFIFLFTILLFLKKKNRETKIIGITAWGLTFTGLVTGMLWAQLAWGNYWSWDPKENMTLILFIATTSTMLAHLEKHPNAAKWLSLLSSVLAIVTASTSFILTGLHSFLH
jgi:ABC-type transport system involved in cytochrome c biogenesis permease subunit